MLFGFQLFGLFEHLSVLVKLDSLLHKTTLLQKISNCALPFCWHALVWIERRITLDFLMEIFLRIVSQEKCFLLTLLGTISQTGKF
jgi:hypothetical protein